MRNKLCGAALFLLIFSSCKDEYTICDLPKEVNFIAGFYQRSGSADVAVAAPNLSIFAFNAATPVYNGQANARVFSLPLNPLVDSAKYVVTVQNGQQSDTVTIVYTSISQQLSQECGSIIFHNISRINSTAHTIDSIKISNPAINNTAVQNAKIYF